MKTKCMSCKSSMKKMAVGGTTTKRIIKKSTGGMYGIPQENLGTSGQYGFAKKGGSTGTHKMPNGKMMLNSKMQKGGATKKSLIKDIDPGFNKTPKRPYKNMDPWFTKKPSKPYRNMDPGFSKTPKINSGNKDVFENAGPAPQLKRGGATKATKFAALAPPYNKATFADRIAGAKKKK